IAGELDVAAAFQLDQLAMVMMLVVTGVGTLIHVFSVGYMRDDPGYPRYFAYLNLFVAFMLVLVLGASYPVLFIGWEGVGLCSYLLIGFWFSEKANADAGKKAFIVNRIGDFGFLIAMFMLWSNLGALDFAGVAARAPELATGGAAVVTAICLFLFLGCAGKSAQIPLYVWLPDAMAGPTPVSALIHAATMVTAGVYLVARSSFLFALSPVASLTVAVVGALTALLAATIGLKQWDIKKVLAYSTVSQLGYMFVAVGVGAYVAGMFHLVTHAFFKALLFLGSGSVIYAMHRAFHATHRDDDAQDMRNMGGLGSYMRVTWVLMWIATLAIAGIPFFAGFFSKDEILTAVFARTHGSTLADVSWLGIPGGVLLYAVYAIALASALLTAIYMTRMMLYTFHGPNRTGEEERRHLREAPAVMTVPLVVLGVLSLVGGWLNLPAIALFLGPAGALDRWLEPVVGAPALLVTNGETPHLEHST
ncbi:MAG: NADH-quinone oxidoreductase subunit L, partial [Gemmatimonadaceae bacterium]